jgi:hypothetical protein
MKFVLSGRVYNTESSEVAAVYRGSAAAGNWGSLPPDAESIRYEHVLYRTASGNFFVHMHETVKYKFGKPVVEDRAIAYSPEDAVQWIQVHSAMVLDSTGLPLPDEA